jgi:hypothetical protein
MTSPVQENWIDDLRDYCRSLNISTEDLYHILTDLKVSPMIRGKAFEFSLYARLKQLLPSEEWLVTKPLMNAQTGTHDIDVMVRHIPTNKIISVECKLAGKGSFSVAKRKTEGKARKGDYLIAVKCMRSRTTKTPAKVAAMAKQLGVSEDSFLAHSDQYRISNFNVVATSIGNAFYETLEDEDGNMMYRFHPSDEGREFIKRLQPPSDAEAVLQEFVYNKIYLVYSGDVAVSRNSGVVCGKRACTNKYDCGFIPNYPLINFGNVKELPEQDIPSPQNHWTEMENCESFFAGVLDKIQ